MSQKTNYFRIGAFVFAGAAIAIVGVVLLGAGAMFEKKISLETYIDQSVQGLDVGSPVKRRGVKVGEVAEIAFVADKYDLPDAEYLAEEMQQLFNRLIYVRIELPAVEAMKGRSMAELKRHVQTQIELGLRVRLASQGITGTAFMEADYLDPERYPPMEIGWEPADLYIPSAPGSLKVLTDSIERILVKVEEIDVQGITESLERNLELLGEQIEGLGTEKISDQVQKLVSDLRESVAHMNDFLGEASGAIVNDVAATTAAVRRVVEEAEEPVTTMLSEDVPETMQTANRAGEKLETATESLLELLAQLQITLRRFDSTMVEERRDVADIMDNLRVVSENLKAFTEEAKAYPSRAIFGGPPTRKEQP
jgi:phospholipid/cholesterol/gamma-HCH transport system substrate-binding protein/paraquat-inducible protein B